MNWIHRGARPAVICALALGALVAGPLAAQEQPTVPLVPEPVPLPPEGTPVVYVNTQAILPIAPGADSAGAAFQRLSVEFENELGALATEINSLIDTYQQQQSLLDPAGRQQQEQEIRDKQQQAATRQQELEVELDRRRAALLEPIVARVNEVIEEIRSERSYSIVLDIAGGVVAADTTLDITTSVLERLGVDLAAISAPPGS
ncbi:OmpH family outer membrane protein [Candidatus Palauibacter sp.]|uniref:OmpH family outer membrane protein n=1 Tax=Candidatus Palauibacter sp. TaxID=3101350 RepID=UPI003B52352F